jgi:hypothetical protein
MKKSELRQIIREEIQSLQEDRKADFLRQAFAKQDNHGYLVVTQGGKFGKKNFKKGQKLTILGRTSKALHPSQQGLVVMNPSGRGEFVVYDHFLKDESVFKIVKEGKINEDRKVKDLKKGNDFWFEDKPYRFVSASGDKVTALAQNHNKQYVIRVTLNIKGGIIPDSKLGDFEKYLRAGGRQ